MSRLEALARRGALPALVALGRRGTMGLGDFTTAADMANRHGKKLAQDLARMGLIEMVTARYQGGSPRYELRLLPLGAALLPHLEAIEAILAAARIEGETTEEEQARARRVVESHDEIARLLRKEPPAQGDAADERQGTK